MGETSGSKGHQGKKKANDEQKRRTEARRKNKEAKKADLGGVEPSNFAFQPEWLYNGATGPVAYFLLLCSFVSYPLTPCTAFAPVDPWMWRLRNYSVTIFVAPLLSTHNWHAEGL